MRRFITTLTLLALCACQPQVVQTPPEFNYAGKPYVLNVATINSTQDYVSPRHAPNVEHMFALTPAQAFQKWVSTRLVAAGSAGSLEVDIKDASVKKRELPKEKTGIEGAFTREQTEQYDGVLDVTLKIYNGRKPLPIATVTATAQQTLSLSEDATIEEHKILYQQMTVNLMNAINAELDRNIHQYFANYLQQ